MELSLTVIIDYSFLLNEGWIFADYREKLLRSTHLNKWKTGTMKPSLYWLEGPWRGRLAIAARPRGGEWLEDEILAWRKAGIDTVVSMLTPSEVAEMDLAKEASWCRANNVTFCSLPVPDRGVPSSRTEVKQLVQKLEEDLSNGRNAVVHCRQGLGRAALLAACVEIGAGLSPEAAFRQISIARGQPVPETPEQRQWVTAWKPRAQ